LEGRRVIYYLLSRVSMNRIVAVGRIQFYRDRPRMPRYDANEFNIYQSLLSLRTSEE
jgi:hypothetical protein